MAPAIAGPSLSIEYTRVTLDGVFEDPQIRAPGDALAGRARHLDTTAALDTRHPLASVTASSRLAASRSRVDAVVELVGLGEVGGRRAGRFSLGMGQRLGIATALLGDPATVILDEPLNGLDPQGIRWVRSLLGDLAADGRTVFVSSHLPNELALTAQHLIVIGRGRLLADTGVADFLARAGAAGCGSPAPTRRRWPPGSARGRWPSRRAPVGP